MDDFGTVFCGDLLTGVEISSAAPGSDEILTPAAVEFVYKLHAVFDSERRVLLEERKAKTPGVVESARPVREMDWKVAEVPADLRDRRVEITGPAERKMMINALNSGASVFMADIEDALSPTWANVIQAQVNLRDAVRRELTYTSPEGKSYALNRETATLVVRPRGWHLEEEHFRVFGQAVSASLFDFGLFFFHNAHELIRRGTGPYFYLPKMESHLEARLWERVFRWAQAALGIPHGTIRATVLIETIPAAFEMEEILFELKDHAAGLNAGRWDYLFSIIKKLGSKTDFVFPDRSQLTMSVPFMQAYCKLLVRACHRRGAHAIGGMSAFIPTRKDPEANARAFDRVREDKAREAEQGFDGTWVAHPDLVPIARAAFDRVLRGETSQKRAIPEEPSGGIRALFPTRIEGGKVTREGLLHNVSVALQYLSAWFTGQGAVAIFNLMEDAATAEISRAELWQWVHRGARLESGETVTQELVESVIASELKRLGGSTVELAAQLLRKLVYNQEFEPFLTLPAYRILNDR